MKSSVKKRVESLENMLKIKSNRKRSARVVYDASSGFDPSTLKIDAEVVLILPDNGRRGVDKKDFSDQPYKIFYG
jgi:hypothetical protein